MGEIDAPHFGLPMTPLTLWGRLGARILTRMYWALSLFARVRWLLPWFRGTRRQRFAAWVYANWDYWGRMATWK